MLNLRKAAVVQEYQETIKVPDDTYIDLENQNVIPDSLRITDPKKGEVFERTEGGDTLSQGQYFVIPEDGALYFSDADVGKTLEIRYEWSDEPLEDDEEDEFSGEDETPLSEDELRSDVDHDSTDDFLRRVQEEEREDEEPPGRNTPSSKSVNDWGIDDEWFKADSVTETVKVDESLTSAGIDVSQGKPTVVDKASGEHYKVIRSKTSKHPKTFGIVVFVPGESKLLWDESAKGHTFSVSFSQAMTVGREVNKVNGFKERIADLWTRLFDHPDPRFVLEKLIPMVEGEISSARAEIRSKLSDSARLTQNKRDRVAIKNLQKEWKKKLEGEKARREEMRKRGQSTDGLPSLTEMFGEKPTFSSQPLSEGAVDDLDEQISSSIPSLTGDFLKLEHLLEKVLHGDRDAKSKAHRLVRDDIAPRLVPFHSLASLVSEHLYDLQSSLDEDGGDIREFEETGYRSFDPDDFLYMKRVRQEANSIDAELTDFSRYYTGQILKWIREPGTYFRGTKMKDWTPIRMTFDRGGVTLSDLYENVALPAFRDAVLAFDYSKRVKDENTGEELTILSSPMVKMAVQTALKAAFDKVQSEQENRTTRGESEKHRIEENATVELRGKLASGEQDVSITDDTGVRYKIFIPVSESTEFTAIPGTTSLSGYAILKVPPAGRRYKDQTATLIRKGETKPLVQWPSTRENKLRLRDDENAFIITNSQIMLGPGNVGKTFLVSLSWVAQEKQDIPKNHYVLDLNSNRVYFSPENVGDTVTINYVSTILSKRMVSPSAPGGGGYEGEEGDNQSFVDTALLEMNDPSMMEQEDITKERINDLMSVIGDIVLTETDPRLDMGDRAILSDTLGLNTKDGARLSVNDIIENGIPGLDLDKISSHKDKVNAVRARQNTAMSTLLEILREKSKDEKFIGNLINPLKTVFERTLDKGTLSTRGEDVVLSYLRSPDVDPRSKTFFSGLLKRSGLSSEEENVLRLVWGIKGPLAGDRTHKTLKEVPKNIVPPGNLGKRLKAIADLELGSDSAGEGTGMVSPKMEEITLIYHDAVDLVLNTLDKIWENDSAKLKERLPAFAALYKGQRVSRSIQDELSAISLDKSLPNGAVSSPPEKPALPLYDQLKTSLPSVDPEILKSLMQEAVSNFESGGAFSDLLDSREAELDKIKQKNISDLEKRTKDSRSKILEMKDSVYKTDVGLSAVDGQLRKVRAERDKILKKLESNEGFVHTSNKIKAGLNALHEIEAAIHRFVGSFKEGTPQDVELKEQDRERLENRSALKDLLGEKSLQALREQTDPKVQPVALKAYEKYSPLAGATSPQEAEAALPSIAKIVAGFQDALKKARASLVSSADNETQKSLKSLERSLDEVKSQYESLRLLRTRQDRAIEDAQQELQEKIAPRQKMLEEHLKNHNSSQELDVLRKVQRILQDRPDLQRGDGSFNLKDMFKIDQSPQRSPGYIPPKSSTEDTYMPAPDSGYVSPGPVEKKKEVANLEKVQEELESLVRKLLSGDLDAQTFLDRVTSAVPATMRPAPIARWLGRAKGRMSSPQDAAEQIAEFVMNGVELEEGTEPKSTLDRSTEDYEEAKGKKKRPFKPPMQKRSLYDDLLDFALPPDPDETFESYEEKKSKFRSLVEALREAFSAGIPINEFNPKLSAKDTLDNQQRVIYSIAKYLLSNRKDLSTEKRGVWNLEKVFVPTHEVPVEVMPSIKEEVKLKDQDRSIQQLLNHQEDLDDHTAKVLYALSLAVNKFHKTPSKIIRGTSKGGEPARVTALRLELFMRQHPELQAGEQWDFSPLFDGTLSLPSAMMGVVSTQSIEDRITPLVEFLQKEERRNSEDNKSSAEPPSATREKIVDMLNQMSTMAEDGKSLSEMLDYFVGMDDKGARPYSLSYLFSKVRNFLRSLDKAVGLKNLRNDLGLSSLFAPADAPPSVSPTKIDEVSTPSESSTSMFRSMMDTLELGEKEGRLARSYIDALQRSVEDGRGIPAAQREWARDNRPFIGLMKQVNKFLSQNLDKFVTESGEVNLSPLTGDPQVAETLEEKVDTLQEDAQRAPEKKRSSLKDTIFDSFIKEMDMGEENTFLTDVFRYMVQHPSKEEVLKFVEDNGGELGEVSPKVEMILEFLTDAGLVREDGFPDLEGIVVPDPKEDHESYISKDGRLDSKRLEDDLTAAYGISEEDEDLAAEDFDLDTGDEEDEEEEPESDDENKLDELENEILDEDLEDDDDDFDTSMPEPKQDLPDEDVDDFIETVKNQNTKGIPEDALESREFLKSRGDYLTKFVPSLIEAMGFSNDEAEDAIEVLRQIQSLGVDETESRLESLDDVHMASLLQDILEFAEEYGLSHEDLENVRLPRRESAPASESPEKTSTEDSNPPYEELQRLPKAGRLPKELTNLTLTDEQFTEIVNRSEINEDALRVLLEEIPNLPDMTYRELASFVKMEKDHLDPVVKNILSRYVKMLTSYLRHLEATGFTSSPPEKESPSLSTPETKSNREETGITSSPITIPSVAEMFSRGTQDQRILVVTRLKEKGVSHDLLFSAAAMSSIPFQEKRELLRLIDTIFESNENPARKLQPSPPTSPSVPPELLDALYKNALGWCQKFSKSPQEFSKLLRMKGKENLVGIYESQVMPKVEEELSAYNSSEFLDGL